MIGAAPSFYCWLRRNWKRNKESINMSIRCRTIKRVRVDYAAPITHSMRLLRVFPPTRRGWQTVESLDWKCTPRESTFDVHQDAFGNEVLGLRHAEIKRSFLFEMELVTV